MVTQNIAQSQSWKRAKAPSNAKKKNHNSNFFVLASKK